MGEVAASFELALSVSMAPDIRCQQNSRGLGRLLRQALLVTILVTNLLSYVWSAKIN
ncbi:hypothetical protein DSM107007_30270 [Nostoc sp. PCC 7120 = FACHB-418]|uniref:Uncharacterized protein n=1 Tax=Trichormus variabilis NIES-23 TaxID=1973479 RepID=A0A1Z4KQ10_ANAVA|nr:hypothetical protein DSM107007_30270 [Nostoc sp. PCC 7120 = FACHB-418]BAY71066.1 hypothetical protein NIES23_38790 [Trichormus variabilis NIES-23]